MTKVTIITNNQPRDILYGFNLPEKYRKEFDYLTDEEYVDQTFFIYKRQAYSLREFMRTDIFKDWHGACSDSFFSGVLVKIINDGDSVIVGRYYC